MPDRGCPPPTRPAKLRRRWHPPLSRKQGVHQPISAPPNALIIRCRRRRGLVKHELKLSHERKVVFLSDTIEELQLAPEPRVDPQRAQALARRNPNCKEIDSAPGRTRPPTGRGGPGGPYEGLAAIGKGVSNGEVMPPQRLSHAREQCTPTR